MSTTNRSLRTVLAALASVAFIGALPVLLIGASVKRFGNPSPLVGMKAPWHWTADDVRAWIAALHHGLDSSAEVTDLFIRVALLAAWICAAILLYTVVDEIVHQLRTGMPSRRSRRLGGLGPIGRRMASAIIAVLPISLTTTPALIGAAPAHHAVAAVSVPSGSWSDHVRSPSADGWSMVEVQRGDSIWSIAERVARGRDIDRVAEAIVRANLGSQMIDGQRFATAALIEPGWMLTVPQSGAITNGPPFVGDDQQYTVEAGDSYWRIAEHHLAAEATGPEIAAYTHVLMDLNAPRLGYRDPKLIRPGDVLLLEEPTPPPAPPEQVVAEPAMDPAPVTTPPPTEQAPTTTQLPAVVPVPSEASTTTEDSLSEPVVQVHGPSDGLSIGTGLAAATVLAGSVVAALAVRRRGALRSAPIGGTVRRPESAAVAYERQLRTIADLDAMARLDVALRAAAPEIAGAHGRVLAAEVSDEGAITLFTDRVITLPAPWAVDADAGGWRLPTTAPLGELAQEARRAGQPCPAIVELGQTVTGRLFVDLEAVGVLAIDAPLPVSASIVRALAGELALSPLGDCSRVFTVGLEPECALGSALVEPVESIEGALEAVRTASASIHAATASRSTFELRTASVDGEAWEPSLVLAVAETADSGQVRDLAGGGSRGVGVAITGDIAGAGATLRQRDDGFVLEPLSIAVRPVGATAVDMQAIDDLLTAPVVGDPVAIADVEPATSPAHRLRVSVFGGVEVRSADGLPVVFERSKALELVVWLSLHRVRPTRGAARAALWDTDVRDATFSNVVSDARRAMARVTAPPDGEEWIGRTMTDDLPLHELVGSDADDLERAINAARVREGCAVEAILRPVVAMIEGMPFAGTSYLWPDAEGITSALILNATSAAAMLAAHYLDDGDIDGVFWATGQGLKVLAGHEELIALRMKAHAQRGDLAGVRGEWESYERAILADSWSGAEPSPKLVALRRQLLAPSMAK